MIGIIEMKTENRPEKNLISQDSNPVKNKEWVNKVFPLKIRHASLMIERTNGGNVLTKDTLLQVIYVQQIFTYLK